MIVEGAELCPDCMGALKYYDRVRRVVKGKYGIKTTIFISRWRCIGCRRIHRAIPLTIFPYKQYEADIIVGVIEGLITYETYGFEDFPCEVTMRRWSTQDTHFLLWKGV